MIINFQTVQDTLIVLGTLIGVVVVFAMAIVAASALVQRDKARNARLRNARPHNTRPGRPVATSPVLAQHPTQSDRELVLR
jgi:hypothetical protein